MRPRSTSVAKMIRESPWWTDVPAHEDQAPVSGEIG